MSLEFARHAARRATWLAVGAMSLASCVEPEASQEDVLHEVAGSAQAVYAHSSMWPLEASDRWTFVPYVYGGAEQTALLTTNGPYLNLNNFPGITNALTVYPSGSAIWATSGGSFTKLLDFGDALGSTRVLPTAGMPSALAGATVRYDSRTYAQYDHLNGKYFTGCSRFVVTPPTTATGTVITELVFAPSIGPVLVKTRTAGNEEWWYLKTGSTSLGSVSLPSGPTIPPRTGANLRSLVPGAPVNNPPWTSPTYALPAGTLDSALAAVDTQSDAEWATEQGVMTAFDQGTAAEGLLSPTESLGMVFDPVYWEDLGPASWPPEVLAAYPNTPALQQKQDDLATLNNQIIDALQRAGDAQSAIWRAMKAKRNNLREVKRRTAMSLELEQARYRSEVRALWAETALDVIALIPVAAPVMVTTRVVARLVRPVGTTLRLIKELRSEERLLRMGLEVAKREGMDAEAARIASQLATNEFRLGGLEALAALHVQCVMGAGVATFGVITLNGNIMSQLPPSSNNPHEVIIDILERGIATFNQKIAEYRAERDAALSQARSLQRQYAARLAAP